MLVLLILLAVLALLLLSPVVLTCRLDEDFCLTVSYLFLRFRLYPKKEKEKRPKKKAAKEAAAKQKKPNPFQRMVDEQGFAGAVGQVCQLVKTMMARLGWLLGHAKAKPFHLEIAVGGEDAAAVALAYGGVCAAAYPVLGGLWELMRFGGFRTDIHPDFDGGNSFVKLYTKLRLRPLFAVFFLAGLTLDLVKWKAGQPASQTVKEGAEK